MSIIKFEKDGSVHKCKLTKCSDNIMEIELNETVNKNILKSGFVVLNENNFSIQGDYKKYTTIYQSFEDSNMHYKLSNDGSIYIKPEPIPEPDPYVPTEEELAAQKRFEQIQQLEFEISNLKNQLTSSDYKIIKGYEYSLVDKDSEYDMDELHKERQMLRDNINKLEEELHIITQSEG